MLHRLRGVARDGPGNEIEHSRSTCQVVVRAAHAPLSELGEPSSGPISAKGALSTVRARKPPIALGKGSGGVQRICSTCNSEPLITALGRSIVYRVRCLVIFMSEETR